MSTCTVFIWDDECIVEFDYEPAENGGNESPSWDASVSILCVKHGDLEIPEHDIENSALKEIERQIWDHIKGGDE